VDFEFSEIENEASGNDQDAEKHAECGMEYPERNVEHRIAQKKNRFFIYSPEFEGSGGERKSSEWIQKIGRGSN
jgi:hypothetical protein